MTAVADWILRAREPKPSSSRMVRTKDPGRLGAYLDDAAHYPGGCADELCLPESESHIAGVLAEGGHVLVVGAQSSLTGGATPAGGTVLSLERMRSIVGWTSTGVRVQPGCSLRELEEQLARRDLYYPPVPTYDGASVGGTVATNAAGAATFKYGTTRSWVEALTVVLPCGDVLDISSGRCRAHPDGYFELVRVDGTRVTVPIPDIEMPAVPKNSAGYFGERGMDLIDLFIGAEGTLGIVTEIELRLVSRRPEWLVCLLPLADDGEAIALTQTFRDGSLETRASGAADGIDVAAIEYIDRRSIQLLIEDGVPQRESVALGSSAGAALFVQLELPPGTSAADASEQLAGGASACRGPLPAFSRILERHGVLGRALPALPGENARRRAILALREAVPEAVNRRIKECQRGGNPGVSKAGADVIVPFSCFAEGLVAYRRAMDARGLDHATWGHVSDGNIHPNLLPRSDVEMALAREALMEIGREAIRLGGSPMSEHGVGRNPVKQALLKQLYGDDGVASMRATRAALDPGGVLAPGVLWPVS